MSDSEVTRRNLIQAIAQAKLDAVSDGDGAYLSVDSVARLAEVSSSLIDRCHPDIAGQIRLEAASFNAASDPHTENADLESLRFRVKELQRHNVQLVAELAHAKLVISSLERMASLTI